MKRRPRDRESSHEITRDYQAGAGDHDLPESRERFSKRSKFHQQNKTRRTQEQRESQSAPQIDLLELGRVRQVHSKFCDVLLGSKLVRCAVRRTLGRVRDDYVVVGDFVRVSHAETGEEGMIERVEPRQTVLTRADSFKQMKSHPIVANAEAMLIVASIVMPRVKWGLVDRMLVASQSGGLKPIICLNKIDLADDSDLEDAREKLAHYRSMGVECIETSVTRSDGLERVRSLLSGQITVLAGHSGVGKSSLVRAVLPGLDIRVGEVSGFNEKGRHTTTSARVYPLESGEVIDTPGVKLFGLWQVDRERLDELFQDVVEGTAPQWRVESHARIAASLLAPGT